MTINVSTRSLVPTVLNLGSGKDYRGDCFNIDIDDSWSPDAVVDFGAFDLDAAGIGVSTHRFGEVRLHPGCFDTIMTNDVLEHVPNLTRLMTNCLKLLRTGGTFEISVPYDLSFGAWQDPTHVRAFNERSWLYYTDWFWYLGWSEARFALERLNFVPNEAAADLAQTLPAAELLRRPRMIDSMSVTLRKVDLTPADRQTWEHWRERKRQAQARWSGPAPAMNAVPAAPAPATPAAQPPMPSAIPAPTSPVPTDLARPFAGGLAAHRDRHCIWIVTPDGYRHQQAFEECATALSEAFAELGGSAPVVRDPRAWTGRTPIVLGPHLLHADAAAALPSDSVLVNFEQVAAGEGWINEDYLALLRRFRVLDYSIRNREALAARGIPHAGLLGIGCTPGLIRIPHDQPKDIDVLFYGSLNPRRKRALEALKAHGIGVVNLFGAYGAERDAAIARAKLVLNLHFYESAIFEVVRVSYLLANGICVLSEGEAGDPDLEPFAGGLAVCRYDEIVDRCAALLADEAARRSVAERGQALMRARRQADLLKTLIGD